MRNWTKRSVFLLAGMGLCLFGGLQAQLTSRSGKATPVTKVTDVTETLPCAGSVLLSEDFEAGIPGTWTVIDGDGNIPRPELLLVGGWQGRADYRDSLNNKVAATPSWYTDSLGDKSNDWLITPAILVGSNSCVSWKFYSQDQFFKESMEVWVGTAADTTSLLAGTLVYSNTAVSGTPAYASAALAAFAGQTVYIGFRQVSTDKFVLCLDDVLVSNVNQLDMGVYAVSAGNPDPGDSVTLRFTVANYGSDTITSFQAIYSIEGGPAKFMTITAVSLPPNATVSFDHDSVYVSDTLDAFYDICAWTNLPNGQLDQDIHNDTLCTRFDVGSPVGTVDPSVSTASITAFPNPFTQTVTLRVDGLRRPGMAELQLLDLGGRVVFSGTQALGANGAFVVDGSSLPAGIYIAHLRLPDGSRIHQKLIRK